MTHDAPVDQNELLGLLSDLSRLLLHWSWEGVVGYETIVEQVGRSYGLYDVSVYMTAQSASIRVGDRVTFEKVGIPAIPPLGATQTLKEVLPEIYAGNLSVTEARRRVQGIAHARPLYGPWLVWAGIMIIGMAFAVDVVGTWEGVVWGGLTGTVVGVVFLMQNRFEGFNKIAPLVAALASGIVVMLAWRVGWVTSAPGLLLIASTFVFIPGDSISTQAYELAAGRWSAGVDRLFYAIIMLVLMAAGAALAQAMTGVPRSELFPTSPNDGFAWWAAYPARAFFLVGILLVFQMRWAHFPTALLTLWMVTAVAQGVTVTFGGLAGTFSAMAVAVILADWQGRTVRGIEPYILLIPVIFALSPGSHGLRQLEVWVSGTPSGGIQDLETLFGTLLAIAVGLVVGRTISESWRLTPRRYANATLTKDGA